MSDYQTRPKLMSNKAWAKNQSNDTKKKNLQKITARDVDAPGMETESLKEDEEWVEKR